MCAQHRDTTDLREELAQRPLARRTRQLRRIARAADSYGLVLVLIFLDYIAMSALDGNPWGRVITASLLGATLLVALHTSSASRRLMIFGALCVALGALTALLGALSPAYQNIGQLGPAVSGLLLVVAMVVIVRRVSTHSIVTVETVLGAIDVYLLAGMTFALIYAGLDVLGPVPFFAGVPHATANDFLFFSYTTLTTVGYGNLVPAGNVGMTMAMVEALFGQIFLVIVVARLVSLWGQARPHRESRLPRDEAP